MERARRAREPLGRSPCLASPPPPPPPPRLDCARHLLHRPLALTSYSRGARASSGARRAPPLAGGAAGQWAAAWAELWAAARAARWHSSREWCMRDAPLRALGGSRRAAFRALSRPFQRVRSQPVAARAFLRARALRCAAGSLRWLRAVSPALPWPQGAALTAARVLQAALRATPLWLLGLPFARLLTLSARVASSSSLAASHSRARGTQTLALPLLTAALSTARFSAVRAASAGRVLGRADALAAVIRRRSSRATPGCLALAGMRCVRSRRTRNPWARRPTASSALHHRYSAGGARVAAALPASAGCSCSSCRSPGPLLVASCAASHTTPRLLRLALAPASSPPARLPRPRGGCCAQLGLRRRRRSIARRAARRGAAASAAWVIPSRGGPAAGPSVGRLMVARQVGRLLTRSRSSPAGVAATRLRPGLFHCASMCFRWVVVALVELVPLPAGRGAAGAPLPLLMCRATAHRGSAPLRLLTAQVAPFL